jgi:hypothetical protein
LVVIWISARRVLAEILVIGFSACVALVFLIPHSIVCHISLHVDELSEA